MDNMDKQGQKFISLEAASGLLLILMLAVAMLIANSPLSAIYESILDVPIQVRIGDLNVEKSLLLWINEGLMAIFFLLLALEIKREIMAGELSQPSQILLPLVAAIGGIILPAGVYLIFNYGHADTQQGWPIPTTTDIAFALGIVALLGKRVPISLKVFLVALSIVDDFLAVSIIAIVFTADLSLLSLSLAGVGIIALMILNRCQVSRLAPYILIAIFMWVCVLKSGIHATLAGAVVGGLIPYKTKRVEHSPLQQLEKNLHPWVAFLVLPLFVFANGGVIFQEFAWADLLTRVPLGIGLGLFVGKGLGVFICCGTLILLGLVKMPSKANWGQLLGISCLTGIGFTMSLFLGALAFFDTPYLELMRQGVLFGSLLSGVVGITAFWLTDKFSKESTT